MRQSQTASTDTPKEQCLIFHICIINWWQWRIQDFPEEGAPTPRGGRQNTILPNFPKNCMKLKEFGPPGGRAPPLDPPLDGVLNTKCNNI